MKTIHAALGIITQDGKYLLQLRNHKNVSGGMNKIGFFGGMIEANETPVAAACRELREETSLDLYEQDFQMIDMIEQTSDYRGELVTMKAWLFAADIPANVEVQCFEGELIRLTFAEAQERLEELTPGTELAFKTILKG